MSQPPILNPHSSPLSTISLIFFSFPNSSASTQPCANVKAVYAWGQGPSWPRRHLLASNAVES
uniref:Uncharacterized protein n=1 Tax=Leersia perrieri TaxID=77586 RepID=A0A0D9WWG0_9ORYZ